MWNDEYIIKGASPFESKLIRLIENNCFNDVAYNATDKSQLNTSIIVELYQQGDKLAELFYILFIEIDENKFENWIYLNLHLLKINDVEINRKLAFQNIVQTLTYQRYKELYRYSLNIYHSKIKIKKAIRLFCNEIQQQFIYVKDNVDRYNYKDFKIFIFHLIINHLKYLFQCICTGANKFYIEQENN